MKSHERIQQQESGPKLPGRFQQLRAMRFTIEPEHGSRDHVEGNRIERQATVTGDSLDTSTPLKWVSIGVASRMALAAQGFTDRPPSGQPTVRHIRRAMVRMSVLQLDSVNVLCRSHYLPLLARLGPYDRAKLDRYLYYSGEHFEYLGHEASITAQDLHPHLRWRMARSRWRHGVALEQEVPDYVQAVLHEVAERGPLTVKDLSDPGNRTGPWWGQSKGKVALEWLYVSGRLAIRQRNKMFVTAYDLPERVIRPEVLAAPDLDDKQAFRHLLMMAARSHGIGTAADLADYFRLTMPVARPLLAELVDEGELIPVEVEGWREPGLVHPEAKRPRQISGRALLSPFDPVVWFRPRAERLFDFVYRIEIYVPEAKRVYGYYVLPFLLDGELVGRVCLKADRKQGRLLARASFAEEGTDRRRVAAEMEGALVDMAQWLGLDQVEVAELEEEHEWGWVDHPERAVDVQRHGAGPGHEPLGRDDLEDVAGPDVLLGPLDGGEVVGALEVRGVVEGRLAGRLDVVDGGGRGLPEPLDQRVHARHGVLVGGARVDAVHPRDRVARTVVIVPTARLAAHLLARFAEVRPGWLGLEVLHFRHLALRVLSESGERLPSLLHPYPSDEMTAHPVTTLVNSPDNDKPGCIEPQ